MNPGRMKLRERDYKALRDMLDGAVVRAPTHVTLSHVTSMVRPGEGKLYPVDSAMIARLRHNKVVKLDTAIGLTGSYRQWTLTKKGRRLASEQPQESPPP